MKQRIGFIVVLLLLLLTASGCVYFNTFYHARGWFNQAESSRRKAKRDEAQSAEIKLYQDAIKKSSKVLNDHPHSGYVDDALYIIGESYYYLKDFPKAERKFRELLSAFPKSKYADETRFFLGKTRFRMENYLLAREVFKEYIEEKKNNQWRGEAIYLMGESSLLESDSTTALQYYQQYVNEYKSDSRVPDVQYKIGDIQFKQKDFAGAVASYTAAADAYDDPKAKYHARYDQGRAMYLVDSVRTGLALFRKLLSEQKDSVFVPDLQLRIAEGEYLSGDEEDAILLYDDVTTGFATRPQSAEAFYRMGLIVQDQWGDLELAKDLYDQAAKNQQGGDYHQLALAKSSDLTKVEKYRSELSDEAKKNADDNRFMLAELYRTAIDQPDSAMTEYQSLIDNFPESEFAPKSLLAIGWLYENHYHDTTKAHESYKQVIDKYPRSDEYGDALKLLGLVDTQYDSVYAEKLYMQAESQYFDQNNPDSAMALFRRLIEEYPQSKLVPQADFAIAKIKLLNFTPKEDSEDSTYVDSTMIQTFAELAERYPDTPVGVEATRLSAGEGKAKLASKTNEKNEKGDSLKASPDSSKFAAVDTVSEAQQVQHAYDSLLANTPLITIEKPTLEGTFTYPINATGAKLEGRMQLRIKIDYNGKVSDVQILKGLSNDDIDREVKKAMLETYFDPLQFDPLKIGGYFIYNYEVILPEMYR